MKWFFNWMFNGLQQAQQQKREEEDSVDREQRKAANGISIGLVSPKPSRRFTTAGQKVNPDDTSVNLNANPMHFKIYPATGGHIVEYMYYNEKKDTHDQALHLIPSDLDLGTELAKIMTLEALKR